MTSQSGACTPSAKIVTAARLRAGTEDSFHEWNVRVVAALAGIAGYSGRDIIPPQSEGLAEWVMVTHFDSLAQLIAWRDSEARNRLYAEARPFLEDGAFTELAGDAAAQFQRDTSATEVIVERVLPGKEDRYRAWSTRVQQAQAKMPGFQGGYTQPPGAGGQDWVTLLRFKTVDDLNGWLNSPERAALLKEAAALVKSVVSHQVRTSFPGWTPTDAASGQSPPNWKTTMLVLLGLYPIVSIEIAYLMRHLSGLTPALADFIGNSLSVVLVAYIAMPLLVRWMDWWLFPRPESAARATLLGTALVAALYAIEIVVFSKLL
jgi:uncharacterized protein